MPQQAAALNTDTAGTPTSGEYADRGDGTSKWFAWHRKADGADAALGAKADAAATTVSSASLISLVKGLLSRAVSPYPVGATPIRGASGNVANASAVATLAAASGKTTYLTAFQVTFSGATGASVVNVTVAGTTGGSLTYAVTVPAGATAAGTPLVVPFPYPVPASATNTAITVTLPALGSGNTNACVVATGFQL